MIKYESANAKTQNLIDECYRIYEKCSANDGVSNTFFIDEDYRDYSAKPFLYYAMDGEMVGFLSVYPIDNFNVEFCIYVDPDYRRQHIASELFFRMVSDFEACSFKCSLPDDEDDAISEHNAELDTAKTFLEKMGFHFASTECKMTMSKNDYIGVATPMEVKTDVSEERIVVTGIVDEKPIGRVIVSAFNMVACIHDVEIDEELREQGYGYQLVMTVLSQTFDRYDTIQLHVTKENEPAFNLYRKCGFQINESIKTYEL